jgi:hypothetical protein
VSRAAPVRRRGNAGGRGAGGGEARRRRREATVAATAELGSLPTFRAFLAREMTKSRSVELTGEEDGAFIPPPFSPEPWLQPGLNGGL